MPRTSSRARELDIYQPLSSPRSEFTPFPHLLISNVSILMNFEASHVALDDIGRQALTLSKHHSPAELVAKIDAITTSDLTGMAQRLTKSPLTFVAYGDLQNVPRYETVANRFK